MDKKDRIEFLIGQLNVAAKAYYVDSEEIMSNFEYDKMYDELVDLEKETGIILSNSPTVNVGYETVSALPKEAHESRMLSLDKTKDVDALVSWVGDKKALLSWKLDGLTVVLTYEGGKLSKAVTRGNGEIGEVITNNAKVFVNLPVSIAFKGKLVIRGEAFIKYSDFQRINEEIPELDAKYKNPRNLASGSVRQLSNEITAKRSVNFKCFSLASAEENGISVDFKNSIKYQLEWVKNQGFDIVDFKEVTATNLKDTVKWFAKEIETMDIPSDGLVLTYDDIEYGKSLGNTAKFPRNAIAFKWQDEIQKTTLEEIEWNTSRTGLINPVAIFEPVELEGTTVSRASVHNVSILKELKLGIGDTISVYKANMIIPQIADNLTKSGPVEIPRTCYVCNSEAKISDENGVETLYCTNPECPAKKIKSFALFVSRDAINIENLSEATIEKLVAKGFIKDFDDIFKLETHKDEIVTMEGFGEKSYDNLVAAIEKSRNTTTVRLLYALGIAGIGLANAKLIAKGADFNWEKIKSLTVDELIAIDGIGNIMADAFVTYFKDEKHLEVLDKLEKELTFEKESAVTGGSLEGKVFVVTGDVHIYKNRNELKSDIESLGGKVTGSVSAKTDYLINNDVGSNSSKNKKAKELGIPIISEDEFAAMIK